MEKTHEGSKQVETRPEFGPGRTRPKIIYVEVEPGLHEALQSLGKLEERSMSGVVRRALRTAIELGSSDLGVRVPQAKVGAA